jgi:hypothetical protein
VRGARAGTVALGLIAALLLGIGAEHAYQRAHGTYAAYCDTPRGGRCVIPGYPSRPQPYYLASGGTLVLLVTVVVAARMRTRRR